MKPVGRINVGETANGEAVVILHLRGEAGEDPKAEYEVRIGGRLHNGYPELWQAFRVVRDFANLGASPVEEPLASEPTKPQQPPVDAEEEGMTDDEKRRQDFRLISVSALTEGQSDAVRLTSGEAMLRVAETVTRDPVPDA